MALATKGTVRLARGLASSTNVWPSLTANCTFNRTTNLEGVGEGGRLAFELGHDLRAQRLGRQRAGGVPRVDASLFDVLHHPGNQHLSSLVAQRVDVDLDGVLQEAVDEHRTQRHPDAACPFPGRVDTRAQVGTRAVSVAITRRTPSAS